MGPITLTPLQLFCIKEYGTRHGLLIAHQSWEQVLHKRWGHDWQQVINEIEHAAIDCLAALKARRKVQANTIAQIFRHHGLTNNEIACYCNLTEQQTQQLMDGPSIRTQQRIRQRRSGAKRQHIPAAIKSQIIELAQQGKPPKEIAELFSLNCKTVWKMLERQRGDNATPIPNYVM